MMCVQKTAERYDVEYQTGGINRRVCDLSQGDAEDLLRYLANKQIVGAHARRRHCSDSEKLPELHVTGRRGNGCRTPRS